ncbi:MAG: hypothetical protein ACM3WV_00545 [Bacillota bacterium]
MSDTELRPSIDDRPFFFQHVKADAREFTRGVHKVREFYPQPFLLIASGIGSFASQIIRNWH